MNDVRPFPRLTPVQAVQARPSGCWVRVISVLYSMERKNCNITPFLELLFHQQVSPSQWDSPSCCNGRSPSCLGGRPKMGRCLSLGAFVALFLSHWHVPGLSGPLGCRWCGALA